jgi:hypothetical protein
VAGLLINCCSFKVQFSTVFAASLGVKQLCVSDIYEIGIR